MAVPRPLEPEPEPENSIVFETDKKAREDPRSQSARSYLIFVARYCPNGVGEAVVKKIEHMKSSEAPFHEFLLCYVQDRNVPTRQAVIRIERFNQSHVTPDKRVFKPALPPLTRLSQDSVRSSSPSLFGGAVDVFTITCNINTKRSDATLSTLIFHDNSGFTADEAAMVCQIASECADEYNALGHQCHWYAWVIYRVIQVIYLDRFDQMLAEGNRRRGMGHGVKIQTDVFIPSTHSPEKLAQIHRERWAEWKADIEIEIAKKMKRNDPEPELRQELDRRNEEIDMLRRELANRG